jgi:DNA-binding SARP family transcriptional activator/tetratricopeptide (TPR) repeat protein
MVDDCDAAGIRLALLGGFRADVAGRPVPHRSWPSRRAAELVQLLALADGHRLVREQVLEALWPHLDPDAAAANLRKAAHHARQALGSQQAVVLRAGQVALLPAGRVETDVARFQALAANAIRTGDAQACAAAAAAYEGELLPQSLYEPWAEQARQRLRAQHVELLRRAGMWERVIEVEPTDEPAYRELMRSALKVGSRPAAVRWYGRLRSVLGRELGVSPSPETQAVYDECIAGWGVVEADFVGRDVELAKAIAVLRRGETPPVRAVAVRGPAGIGKSALCRQICSVAAAEGWLVVGAAGAQGGTPYAPLIDIVESLLMTDPSLSRALAPATRDVLTHLTPCAGPAAAPGGAVTRHQVTGALRRLLLARSEAGPVLLVVDDVHEADAATVDVLLQMSTAGGVPILPVLAYRPAPVRDALVHGIDRLTRAGRVLDLNLGPLDRGDAVGLVGSAGPTALDGPVVDSIVELGQGNPFFLLELTGTAVPGSPLSVAASAWEAVTSRFVGLGGDATEMLQRLALTSDALDPAAVVALAGVNEAEAFTLLDDALEAGVLVVSAAQYRFRHDLVRQALLEQLPRHRRVVMHREAARRLTNVGGAPGVIARHWLQAGAPDEAVPWLLAAARSAVALGAFTDACTHLDRLLQHTPENAEALHLRAEALEALGDARAPQAYAAAACAASEPARHDIRAQQALAELKAGDPATALQTVAGLKPTTTTGRLAQALTSSGAAALGFLDPELGTARAAECRRIALESGDRAAIVVASWAQAAAAHARGDLRASVCADLQDTHALPELAVRVFDGHLCVTQRLLYGARPYSDVVAFADSLASEARRLGAVRGLAFALTLRGEAQMLAGHLVEAETDLVQGARLHRTISAPTGEALALQRRAEIALYRADATGAGVLLDEALAVARESDVGFHLLDRIYGTRIAAAQDVAGALAAVYEAESAVRGSLETCPGCRITLAVPAAIATACAGELERTLELRKSVEFLANVVMRLPGWYAALSEVDGHVARAHGDLVGAVEHFRAAAAEYGRAGQRLDEARCTRLAGRLAPSWQRSGGVPRPLVPDTPRPGHCPGEFEVPRCL